MLLQTIELHPETEVEQLFFRYVSHGERQMLTAPDEGPIIVPDAGVEISFDSYFNAFYENYWFRLTSLKTLTLQVEVSGHCSVSLLRQTPQRDIYLVERVTVESDEPTTLTFDVSDDHEFRAEAGRLWFSIDSLGPTKVHSAGWHTPDQPSTQVNANVVFCTFNRQEYLSRVIQAIDKSPAVVDRLGQFTIVNQGASFDVQALGSDLSPALVDKIKIIEQTNLGGCGGFTRGMYETLHDDSFSHFMLLDDDIRIHADSLLRAASFLSFANDGIALGGHMLNLHRPNFLYEAGALLNAKTLETKAIGNDLFLCDPHSLQLFLDMPGCDYNGWWFFGANTDVLKKSGLPMPCFIRGDDIEYGVRLGEEGVRTVPVPGIAVWHEPFYLKLGGWQLYFELRNRLSMATLHDKGDWKSIKGSIRKLFIRDIVMSRYHTCMFIIEAMEDYQKGATECFVTTDAALKKCLDIQQSYGPERIDDFGTVSSGKTSLDHREDHRVKQLKKLASKPLMALKLARVGVASARRLTTEPGEGDGPTLRPDELDAAKVANMDRYMVQEYHGAGLWRFERSRTTERELWQRFNKVFKDLEPVEQLKESIEPGAPAWTGFWDNKFADSRG